MREEKETCEGNNARKESAGGRHLSEVTHRHAERTCQDVTKAVKLQSSHVPNWLQTQGPGEKNNAQTIASGFISPGNKCSKSF